MNRQRLAYLTWGLPYADDIRIAESIDSRIAQMEVLCNWQDGRCAFCGCPGPFVEDHDHYTWETRAFLCHSCNTQEGFAQSNDVDWAVYRNAFPARLLGLNICYHKRMPGIVHLRREKLGIDPDVRATERMRALSEVMQLT